MMGVWILSGRMISPNYDIFDVVNMNSSFLRNLTEGSLLVKSCHGGDILLWNAWGMSGGDQGVSVGWISDNQDFHCLFGVLV
jgi:hypothetical protein